MVGIEKILIPIKESELTLENIKKYLPAIMNRFQQNAKKIEDFYEEYKGRHQLILNKTRKYEDDNTVNNKIILQNIWAMVNFKCGYEFGKPLSFSSKNETNSKEMETFNKYITSIDFDKVMGNVAEWVFATGVGYTFTQPTKSQDLEFYAPYETYFLRADRCAKVYSSYLSEKPLFDIIVTPISETVNNKAISYYILSIYTPATYYSMKYYYNEYVLEDSSIIAEDRTHSDLPLVEFNAYTDKIGIVESCLSSQNALDKIVSCGLDNVEELANQLLIFRNCSLGATEEDKRTTLKNAKEFGALEIFDNGKDIQAEVKTLATVINQNDTNVLTNYILGQMYGNWGVPLASSSVSSGNITQGGGEVANGWQNAYSVAQKELSNLLPSIRSWIKQQLDICKQMPNCPIQTLNENEMEIKPNISRSENLLTKTQSFADLVEHNVPENIAWETCELSGDANAIGKLIQELREEKERKEEKQMQQQMQNKVINSGNTDNINNTEVVKRQEKDSE